MSDANKHYFSMVDWEEFDDVLTTSVEKVMPFIFWAKGKENKSEEFEPISFDPNKKSVKLRSKGGLLSKISGSKLADKEVFIKITFFKSHYFTTSHLSYDPELSEYSITFKGDVYKGQQRENYRLMSSRFLNIQFKIEDIAYPGLDISAGGTSILIPESKKDLFQKDTHFINCSIHLTTKNFSIPRIRIAGQWSHPSVDQNGEKRLKVGIAFEDIPKALEEDLFRFINGEARAEEVRKRMEEFVRSKKKDGLST